MNFDNMMLQPNLIVM